MTSGMDRTLTEKMMRARALTGVALFGWIALGSSWFCWEAILADVKPTPQKARLLFLLWVGGLMGIVIFGEFLVHRLRKLAGTRPAVAKARGSAAEARSGETHSVTEDREAGLPDNDEVIVGMESYDRYGTDQDCPSGGMRDSLDRVGTASGSSDLVKSGE